MAKVYRIMEIAAGKEKPSLSLPLPPTDNRRLIPGVAKSRGGRSVVRFIKSNETREFEKLVAILYKGLDALLCATEKYPIIIAIKTYRPNRRSDATNYIKSIKDVLEGMLYVDDKYVYTVCLPAPVDKENPRADLWIWQVGVEDAEIV